MSIKLFLIISTILFASVYGYETEGEVLVLTDDDFPKVLEDHPYILVEFYAPWCGHCKHLAPVYTEAAAALKEAGSEIKLAKVDADTYKKAAGEYGVRGFPTLFFFINGTRIDYKGERTKDGIISWVSKKILPVTVELSAETDYTALTGNDAVSIVLFATDNAQIETFQTLARADDHNRYYIAVGDLQDNEAAGTVKLIRNFDQTATFNGVFDTLGNWISKNSRPALLPFDQRTIQSIFGQNKKAIIYINTGSDAAVALRDSVLSEAKSDASGFIFSEIDKQSEHFDRFADYIKVPVDQPRIIGIDGGKQKKNVQAGGATAESVVSFIRSVIAGEATEYGLTDAVENIDGDVTTTTDQEL